MDQAPYKTELFFQQALELPVDQRDEFLRIACGKDTALLSRILALLSLVNDGESDDVNQANFINEGIGQRIGRYQLIRILGEGGFGIVYLAEQLEPVTRLVALKIIKFGMDTRAVLRRFEVERQTLAMLDHPDIAHFLDGGQTPSGRPYFVMEYVDGTSITKYCDNEKLSIKHRLELFKKACQAVQHAHAKGVIHRDLKPSNILVAHVDGKAIIKVIDFGISKLLDTHSGINFQVTEANQFIGTPDYMSPEQAANSPDIDTRSDVYSLGVVLYELLTGLVPFDQDQLSIRAYREIRRILSEDEPPTPSRRLSTIATIDINFKNHIEQSRGLHIQKLMRDLRKELEWIPLKAMRKEPRSRYQSVIGLAEDINNYLVGEPLIAAPLSRRYRAYKYFKRNRSLVLGIMAVFVVLLAGVTTTYLQWRISYANELRAQAVTDLVTQSLVSSDPIWGGQKNFTVNQAMAQVIDKLNAGALKSQPWVEADLQFTISRILGGNGEYKQAIQLSEQAGKTLELVFGVNHPYVAQSLNNLAGLYYDTGQYAKVEPLYVRALLINESALGPNHQDVATSLSNLALFYVEQNKLNIAEPLLDRALAIREKIFGLVHADVASSLNNLGGLYKERGDYLRAAIMFKRALIIKEKILSPNHPQISTSLNNLGNLYFLESKYIEAELLFRRSLEINEIAFGLDHPRVADSLNGLAMLYKAQGHFSQAKPLYIRALEIYEKVLGPENSRVANIMGSLASLYMEDHEYLEAELIYNRALEIDLKMYGPNHTSVAASLNNLGMFYLDQKQYCLAESNLRGALEIKERALGLDHPDVAVSLNNLAGLLNEQGQFAQAEDLYERALVIREKVYGPNNADVATNLNNIALLFINQGFYSKAKPLLERALLIREKLFGLNDSKTRKIIKNMICLYDSWNKVVPGKGYAEQAVFWSSKLTEAFESDEKFPPATIPSVVAPK